MSEKLYNVVYFHLILVANDELFNSSIYWYINYIRVFTIGTSVLNLTDNLANSTRNFVNMTRIFMYFDSVWTNSPKFEFF
jgi:hypothetical protein